MFIFLKLEIGERNLILHSNHKLKGIDEEKVSIEFEEKKEYIPT